MALTRESTTCLTLFFYYVKTNPDYPVMKTTIQRLCAILILALTSLSAHADENTAAISEAMTVLDKFMQAFNQRDAQAWSETLNYPHVRFASGSVAVYQDGQVFTDRPIFETLEQTGWDHSHWLSREVVLASPAKVHIATVFQRFNIDNEAIGRYESLYIVTKVNDRWGIQARSSLAP
jgi:hypothetical protein